MSLQEATRMGMDSLMLNPLLCDTFGTQEGLSGVAVPDEVLLQAAQSALRGIGLELGSPGFGGSAAGFLSTMRALHDRADPDRPPYAMIIQGPLALSEWYLGASGMNIGPGLSLLDYHGAEFEVLDRARRAGLRTSRIVASHQDVEPRPAFTFDIQEFVPGADGVSYIVQHPDRAARLLENVAQELVALHRLQPDTESYGYFNAKAADEGVLAAAYRDVRSHYMAGLGYTLHQLGLVGLVGPNDTKSILDFFLTSPVIDQLEGRPRLLHGDIGPHNVIVDSDDERPTLIDFAFTLAGPIEYDLATMQETLGVFGLQHLWPDFLQAYRQAGGEIPEGFELTYAATRLRLTISKLGSLAGIYQAAAEDRRPDLERLMRQYAGVLRQEAGKLGIALHSA